MDSWDGKSRIAPRMTINVNDMSDNRRTCRMRAILELERHFFGNKEEYVFEDNESVTFTELNLSDREMVCLVLDKRTVGRELILEKKQWKDAIEKYKSAYVNFYVTQLAFERERKREIEKEKEKVQVKDSESDATERDTNSLKEPCASGNAIFNFFLWTVLISPKGF